MEVASGGRDSLVLLAMDRQYDESPPGLVSQNFLSWPVPWVTSSISAATQVFSYLKGPVSNLVVPKSVS